jgi:hypothetical protein
LRAFHLRRSHKLIVIKGRILVKASERRRWQVVRQRILASEKGKPIDGRSSSTRSHAPRGNAVCDAPRRLLEPRTTTHGTHPLSVRRSPFPPLPDLYGRWLTGRLHSARDQGPAQDRSSFQLWQEGSQPKLIETEALLRQKLEYIHDNPVKRGYVSDPTHWRYSSARNYAQIESLVAVTTDW